MCRYGMTSYIGAAWRLMRATKSISTMGAILAASSWAVHAKSGLFAGKIGRTNSHRYYSTIDSQRANFS